MSTNWPDGYGKRILPSVDSTMAEAARIADTLSGPVWVLALHQTDARGRRGRTWVNPPGNLAATLILICEGEDPAAMALRSFTASLALYDALSAVGANALSLKWPNDVLLGGRKLAGILLEALPNSRLSIGIGVNLAHAPGPDAVEPDALTPTALAQYGPRVEPQALLDELAPAFARWETQFRTQGFAPIRNAWLSRTSHLGDRIRVRLAGETVTGLFQDIDQSGNLVLAMARETRAIAAGDVYFGG